jgi:AcrR family transcriptional regulator
MAEAPASRLEPDERRRLLIDAASELFAEHAFEEISMREIARRAGISKSLLYHYFPNKIELFRAAVAEHAVELQRAIEPSGEGSPLEQLQGSLNAYLLWIEANAQTWQKLMQSAAGLPEAGAVVEAFRSQTLAEISRRLTGSEEPPPPLLRNALVGWLGHADAAILDWLEHRDLGREQLLGLLLAAFGSALLSSGAVEETAVAPS